MAMKSLEKVAVLTGSSGHFKGQFFLLLKGIIGAVIQLEPQLGNTAPPLGVQ